MQRQGHRHTTIVIRYKHPGHTERLKSAVTDVPRLSASFPGPLFSAHKKAWDEANWLYVSGLMWRLRSEYIDLRDFFTYTFL